MAFGTLAFDTLQTSDSKKTGTNQTLDTSYLYNGSAKAWLAATDAAVLHDSFNISSNTDEGTGDYKYGVTNVFVRSTAETAGFGIALGSQIIIRVKTAEASTSVIDIESIDTGATATNASHAVGVLGDLA